LDGRSENADVEIDIVMRQPLAIGLDEHAIGGGVLKPFAKPQARPSRVARARMYELAVLERIAWRSRSPIGFAGRSLGMPDRCEEDKQLRARADDLVKAASLFLAQKLLRPVAGEPQV
jgi:hypothetical protein